MFYVLYPVVIYLLTVPHTTRSVNPRILNAFTFLPVYLTLKRPSVIPALKLRYRSALFSVRYVKMSYKLSKGIRQAKSRG
jgi:hypothetical protein